jgi:hypothetical protein
MSSNKKNEVVKALFVLDVIGKPPEHLTKTLGEIIKKISEERGVKVVNKKINEPILMKDQKDFYTTFAEIEVEVETISHLAMLMFKYPPAHIEVISPELVELTNNGWSDILSEIARRLHQYDEIAKVLQVQNIKMQRKLKELGVDVEKKE